MKKSLRDFFNGLLAVFARLGTNPGAEVIAVRSLLALGLVAAACERNPRPRAPEVGSLDLVVASAPGPGTFRLVPRAGSPLLGRGWDTGSNGIPIAGSKATLELPVRPLGTGTTRIVLALEAAGGAPSRAWRNSVSPRAASGVGEVAVSLNGQPVEGRRRVALNAEIEVSAPGERFRDGANELRIEPSSPVGLRWLDVTLPSSQGRVESDGDLRSALVSGGPIHLDVSAPLPEDAELRLSLLISPHLLPPECESVLYLVEVESRRETGKSAGGLERTVVLKRRVRLEPKRAAPVARWLDARVSLAAFAGMEIGLNLVSAPSPDQGPCTKALHAWGPLRLTSSKPTLGSSKRENLIVLLVDTLRADRVGAWGAADITTPHLDRLAARHIVFENVVAQGAATVPSIASFFSGRHYHRSSEAFDGSGDSPRPLFAEALGQAGLYRIALVANPLLSAEWGYSRGFDQYHHAGVQDGRYDTAEELNTAFLDRLSQVGDANFLAYVHYMDVHDPYGAPGEPPGPLTEGPHAGEPWDGRLGPLLAVIGEAGARSIGAADIEAIGRAYDDGLRYWDRQLGQLLATLRRRGLLSRTNLAVVSDHGEELLDHGFIGHGHSLYDELIRVPVVLVPSDPELGSLTVSDPVEMLDISATLLDLMGVRPPPGHVGHPVPLRGSRAGRPLPRERERFFETRSRGWARPLIVGGLAGIQLGPWKLVRGQKTGRESLFDLERDARELRDLATEEPRVASDLRSRLDRWLAPPETATRAPSPPTEGMLRVEEEALRNLGYIP